MEIVGPWMTTGFKDAGIDFGVAPPPAGPGEARSRSARASSFAVNAKADDDTKKAAAQFIAFWEKKPSQVTWAEGSGFPPDRTDITAHELAGNPYVAQFGRVRRQVAASTLTGVKEVTQVDSDIFPPAIQRILNGRPPPPTCSRRRRRSSPSSLVVPVRRAGRPTMQSVARASAAGTPSAGAPRRSGFAFCRTAPLYRRHALAA